MFVQENIVKNKKKYEFDIIIPSYSPQLVLALWIVYNGKVALLTFLLLTVLGTILDRLGIKI
jgi:hypothetical protein